MPQERFSEIAVAGQPGKIDRVRGILHGVRILGRQSRNGREYTHDCLAQAVPLYEGTKVYVDHPSSQRPGSRSYRDKIGLLRSVRLDRASLRADLHLNLKHEVAEQVLFDAEHAPDTCGLSHLIDAKTTRGRDGTIIVEAITRVHSVDLVTTPASVAGLFESADIRDRRTVSEIVAQIDEDLEPIREFFSEHEEFLSPDSATPKLAPADRAFGPGIDVTDASEFLSVVCGCGPRAEQSRFAEALGLSGSNGHAKGFLDSLT